MSEFNADDRNGTGRDERFVDNDSAEESPAHTADIAMAPVTTAETRPDLAAAQAAPQDLPFIGDHFLPVDPNNINVETIALVILSCVATVVAAGLLIFIFVNYEFGWLLTGSSAVAATGVIGCFVFAFSWPRLEYKWTQFRIDPAGVEIHHGVLWRHQVCVPIGRVQHADVSQGPLQRINGVATLTMHTAGTSNASVSLEGLNHQMAIDIRDWIVDQRKSHDAV